MEGIYENTTRFFFHMAHLEKKILPYQNGLFFLKSYMAVGSGARIKRRKKAPPTSPISEEFRRMESPAEKHECHQDEEKSPTKRRGLFGSSAHASWISLSDCANTTACSIAVDGAALSLALPFTTPRR